jgi:XTP/dITP diphosphohydrolase
MSEIGDKILLATHNPLKVREISPFLSSLGLSVITTSELSIPEPEETGSTFIDNALLKARHCASYTDLPVLSDDSGLCVEALDNAPNIFSARWAGKQKDFSQAIAKIENMMIGKMDNPKAFFECAIAVVFPSLNLEKIFVERIFGRVVFPPRGDNGMGYDPIFIPDGFDKTFAQMSFEDKYAISHRTNALKKMQNWLENL